MKRFLVLIWMVAVVLVLAACGESADMAGTAGDVFDGDVFDDDVLHEGACCEDVYDEVMPAEPMVWQDFIAGQMSGVIREYMRVEYGGRVYDLLVAYHAEARDWRDVLQAQVFVSQRRDGAYHLLHVLDVPRRMENAAGGLVITDINFDGRGDVLVRLGDFGDFGAARYFAFLYHDGAYVPSIHFSWIDNPVVDAENERIWSRSRCWAAAYRAAIYVFAQGTFIMTDAVTTTPAMWGEGANPPADRWRYDISRVRDGEWHHEVLYTGDPGLDEVYALFGDAVVRLSPAWPAPLTIDQLQTVMRPYLALHLWWGEYEPMVVAAERVPRTDAAGYFWWDSADMRVCIVNAALYQVTVHVREPLDEYLHRLERSPWLAASMMREGDYTVHTLYDYFHEIDGVAELVVLLC